MVGSSVPWIHSHHWFWCSYQEPRRVQPQLGSEPVAFVGLSLLISSSPCLNLGVWSWSCRFSWPCCWGKEPAEIWLGIASARGFNLAMNYSFDRWAFTCSRKAMARRDCALCCLRGGLERFADSNTRILHPCSSLFARCLTNGSAWASESLA